MIVAGRFLVDTTRPLPGAGGGLPAYAAAEKRGRTDLMAVQVRPGRPPRAKPLAALLDAPIDNMLLPYGHGVGHQSAGGVGSAYYVVSEAPPGPALADSLRPWSEAEIIAQCLRPIARTLKQLQQRLVTHRAIRPDNLFRRGPGHPVVLGEACAAPPAALQPAIYEPPYSAACLPCGQGDGTTADDVYALGVTMLVLALGRVPLAELDPAAIVRRKLERGSFAALAGEERLPNAISDLIRGMLAEDPDHRPPAALLFDPWAARARRVAARPARRAQQPLELAGQSVWDARSLAHTIGGHPAEGLAALRDGSVDRWLRRSLGDAALAGRVEERVRPSTAGDLGPHGGVETAALLVRVVAVLDPLAPLWWRGTAFWPDGMGTALAAADQEAAPEIAERLESAVLAEAASVWASARAGRSDEPGVRMEGRQQRATLRLKGPGGGRPRLLYALNPLLPCRSPLLRQHPVVRMQELLPVIEAVAVDASGAALVDAHIAAFSAARTEEPVDAELLAPGGEGALARIRLLTRLQGRYHPQPLPALAQRIAADPEPLMAGWHHQGRRKRIGDELRGLAAAGLLAPMLALIDDQEARHLDERGVARARAALASADAELRSIDDGAAAREQTARRLGQEVAAGIGLTALVVALGLAALG